MFSSVLNPIQTQMRENPQQLALVNDSGSYTFAQLGRRVEGIRQVLRRHTPRCVMIYGHKQLDAAAAMLACAFEAIPFTFTDIANPAARIERIAAMVQTDLILLTCEPRTAFPSLPAPTIITTSLPDRSHLLPAVIPSPEQLFYILTTSGSTGEPKGVKISYGNFAAFSNWYIPSLEAERFPGSHVNHACLSFDMGVMDLFPSLAAGKPVMMLNHGNNIRPRKNLQLLTESAVKASSWFSTPSFLDIMCMDRQFNAKSLPELRVIFVGGEPVSPSLVQTLQTRFPQAEVRHAYGPTETTCVTHALCLPPIIDAKTVGALPLGQPQGTNRIVVWDEREKPLPAGQHGEIVILGPQVGVGYLPNDLPANQAFGYKNNERYYRTGDIGYLDEQGQLFIQGRNDSQIKWHGNRIDLAEIEKAASQCDQVKQSAVIIEKNNNVVAELVLCVHLNIDTTAHRDSLRRDLAQRLPTYMVPRVIRFTGPFPLTLHGKTDRQALMRQGETDAGALPK
ncbi:AMP-binding protein [Dickeya solani]|uniref:D-alanine--poly(Phosphoribitol) ligase subunit n=1 Tax=Dickeya solani D s0432-1 TaxID=1231725 RepID=A0AAV3KDZ7_9GAMM|nr:AMP-binding protein [Dickeya solani]ANE75580.1 alanine-phosphoribitol ligase [Dickeya solani IPO 2222]AUC43031.1 D-alanine--poly(phosphoribitol) ligase subunit 1 [Dickeya solani RNS 08.23.3.1.A]AUH09006.1 alanine-phosphoribitol ligase [Dickeya solani D s0432-1]AUH12986.1 alanine-phosphoribitol ligase [Dickeya solani]AYQ45982.1 D-alanine--poly(phosphoribitol) ligase subunit 1 [Dickeya solani]